MTGNLCCGAAANTLLILQRNRYLVENKIHIFQCIKFDDFSTNGVDKPSSRIGTENDSRLPSLIARGEGAKKAGRFPLRPILFQPALTVWT
jgi:hypothetical protein